MYLRNLFRRSRPNATDSTKADSAGDVSTLELLVIRTFSLGFIALIAKIALTTAESGKLEVQNSRVGFSLSGDSLWAGYAVLAALIGVGLWGFFFNYASSKTYKKLSEVVFGFLLISFLLAKAISA
ncbi:MULTISPECIES: hypothetical protein [Stutzerimonas]|uniref:hypothetical protein n=1 Tax=Stutzerimonas TaxID=2901164 RepID=UPI001F27A88F|nr:hypothetical protein [Stutzerimonas kunmingensis]UIP34195.1 hypothetical protein LW136_07100 [Stutzerimonas kunmingensis]